ncbi:MAG: RsmB/NOP family class I SAM-dependent RNA methyltransferase [Rhizobiales bacterium]|nr:RsmB/NOP family class I SAM-dependent RNA methyltransferase [Hyphomicrobiales bacterium]
MKIKNRDKPLRTERSGDPPGYLSRLIAARAFRRVLRERRQIDEAIGLETAQYALSQADVSLVRAILTVSFRRLGSLRAAMASRAASGEIADAGLLQPVLVTALAQVLFLDVPDHASVDCAVEIAKRDADAKHYASFANALLRRVAAEKADILIEFTGKQNDTPAWLFDRWAMFYGADVASLIAAAHLVEPPVDLTVFHDISPDISGVELPTGSFRLKTHQSISSLPGYAEGLFQVQDVAAALPARLAGAKPGMRIADLCAAPGGKTAQLAAAGAHVVAVERSAARAARLRENLARLKLEADIQIGDATEFTGVPFDAVLLDAPCSATGTIRRHPEIAWTKTLADILALASQQLRMLEAASRLVKPGGLLVFSTCSLELEEGEDQISRFLDQNPDFRRLPIALGESDIPAEMITPRGDLRALPCHLAEWGGADGFFAARLQRIA